ncbi:hypothetical protein H0H92_012305 [Tricholoma furcatifolium]|nr:hypothetical protein H0H92_012305 [Tricholoma furcatifolium]
MPTFDLVVVGAGGGPDETNLSAYLFKPHDAEWHDGTLALEAGSAQGALTAVLRQDPHLFSSSNSLFPKSYTAPEIYSFLRLELSSTSRASDTNDLSIRCFLITHAHLDHISGLVMSAGSLRGPRKRVYATKETLHDLENVFSDRIWPNLASWNEGDEDYKLLYSQSVLLSFLSLWTFIESDLTRLHTDNQYTMIYPDISVRTMPINHGRNERGFYGSAAFFIRHDIHDREFLFFGDVEPDELAPEPRTINVWRAAAPKIPQKLSAIFIECSWPSDRSDDTLYGHLNPIHLVNELVALATEVVKIRKGEESGVRTRPVRKKQKRSPLSEDELAGALNHLRIYVMHCKDDLAGDPTRPMRNVIVSQIQDLVEKKQLGVEILAVKQGMRIGQPCFMVKRYTF